MTVKKYPLTSEAQETARQLVEAWDNEYILQTFELVDVTAGIGAKAREYSFGLGGDDSYMPPPSIGIIRELAQFPLIAIRDMSTSTNIEVTLLQELRNAVANDFAVSDYFLSDTELLANQLEEVLGTILAQNTELNTAISQLRGADVSTRAQKLGNVFRELANSLQNAANTTVVVQAIFTIARFLGA
jgi:hypothetical protein